MYPPLEPEEQSEIDELYDGKYKIVLLYGKTIFQKNRNIGKAI